MSMIYTFSSVFWSLGRFVWLQCRPTSHSCFQSKLPGWSRLISILENGPLYMLVIVHTNSDFGWQYPVILDGPTKSEGCTDIGEKVLTWTDSDGERNIEWMNENVRIIIRHKVKIISTQKRMHAGVAEQFWGSWGDTTRPNHLNKKSFLHHKRLVTHFICCGICRL